MWWEAGTTRSHCGRGEQSLKCPSSDCQSPRQKIADRCGVAHVTSPGAPTHDGQLVGAPRVHTTAFPLSPRPPQGVAIWSAFRCLVRAATVARRGGSRYSLVVCGGGVRVGAVTMCSALCCSGTMCSVDSSALDGGMAITLRLCYGTEEKRRTILLHRSAPFHSFISRHFSSALFLVLADLSRAVAPRGKGGGGCAAGHSFQDGTTGCSLPFPVIALLANDKPPTSQGGNLLALEVRVARYTQRTLHWAHFCYGCRAVCRILRAALCMCPTDFALRANARLEHLKIPIRDRKFGDSRIWKFMEDLQHTEYAPPKFGVKVPLCCGQGWELVFHTALTSRLII